MNLLTRYTKYLLRYYKDSISKLIVLVNGGVEKKKENKCRVLAHGKQTSMPFYECSSFQAKSYTLSDGMSIFRR
jgi:hypothetical protein